MSCACYGCGFKKQCLFTKNKSETRSKIIKKKHTINEIMDKCQTSRSKAILILLHYNGKAQTEDYMKFVDLSKIERLTRKIVPEVETIEDMTSDYLTFDIYLDQEVTILQDKLNKLIESL